MAKQRLVVFSGAGISAESGIQTFRGGDGLWENHRIEDVATPEAWQRQPELVLEFYNQRRAGVRKAQPNAAHQALVSLEAQFDVTVITQNIDDLHERAGSSKVLHLHGEIMNARCSCGRAEIYPLGEADIAPGDCCDHRQQLRPDVVWFGEAVPMMDRAQRVAANADVFIVVGSSLEVYPAALLLHDVPEAAQRYLVDPNIPPMAAALGFHSYAEPAGSALPRLAAALLEQLDG